MPRKRAKNNEMRQLRVDGFSDGYYGYPPVLSKNFYYMHGYTTGQAQAHRQNAEQEAYELECLYRGVNNLSMEEAVKFSERFHRFYDGTYFG